MFHHSVRSLQEAARVAPRRPANFSWDYRSRHGQLALPFEMPYCDFPYSSFDSSFEMGSGCVARGIPSPTPFLFLCRASPLIATPPPEGPAYSFAFRSIAPPGSSVPRLGRAGAPPSNGPPSVVESAAVAFEGTPFPKPFSRDLSRSPSPSCVSQIPAWGGDFHSSH